MRPAAAAPLPAVPTVGNPSTAAGPWPVDAARAHADAQRVLNSIDWSKRDIVIWVPGTSHHSVSERFADAVHASWQDGGVSLTHLQYPASWDIRPSVATGIATLKLVLAGIAAHGGNHRIMLAGESQGAWLLGEALADPRLRSVVDRAVLLGHPSLAKTHWSDGRDPKVLEINDPHDHVPVPARGDQAKVLDAMVALNAGKLWQLGAIGDAVAGNMQLVPRVLRNLAAQIPGVSRFLRNPHDYSGHFTAVVEFLRTGSDGYVTPVAVTRQSAAAATEAPPAEPAARARRRASRQPVASPIA